MSNPRALKNVIEIALDALISDIFDIIPEQEKKGVAGALLPDSGNIINSKGLTLQSPVKLRNQYGLAVLPMIYNMLVEIKNPFLENLHLLEGLDQLTGLQKMGLILWNVITLGPMVVTLFKGLSKLDEDEQWKLPLAIDENSRALLICLEKYFRKLRDINNFPAQETIKEVLKTINNRISQFDAFQLPQTLDSVNDLKAAAKQYKNLNNLSDMIVRGITFTEKESKLLPATREKINAILQIIIKEVELFSDELDKKSAQTISPQEIIYYESLRDFVFNVPMVLLAYAGEDLSAELESLAFFAKKNNILKKLEELTSLQSSLASQEIKIVEQPKSTQIVVVEKSDQISKYIDNMCNELKSLSSRINKEGNNRDIREKTDTAIRDIQRYKQEYLAVPMPSTQELNSLKHNVVNRLDNLVGRKHYRIFSPFESLWVNGLNVLIENFVNTIKGLLGKTNNATTNILNAKERYEARCDFFRVKNTAQSTLSKAVDEEILYKSYSRFY
jgi:hypothetical protein